jgi:hypothetical protein
VWVLKSVHRLAKGIELGMNLLAVCNYKSFAGFQPCSACFPY